MSSTRWMVPAAALMAACAGDGLTNVAFPPPDGMTRVYLTDAPFPYDDVARVDVHIVRIDASTTADTGSSAAAQDWVTVATPDRAFNLLDLTGGQVALLGETELSAATYRAIRVVLRLGASRMTATDGTELAVNWGWDDTTGAGEIAVHAVVEGALDVPEAGANIVLDFDVGRSFVAEASGPGFSFVPWIRAVNQATTGSITGVVRGSDAPLESIVPVPTAAVTVYDRNDCPPESLCLAAPVATGRTDAQGRYAIRYLPAGRYRVEAAPPADFNAGPAVRDTVPVVAGEETALDLYLVQGDGTGGGGEGARIEIGADRTIEINDSTSFNAVVFSETGDSVLNQDVAWESTNPDVASIVVADGGFALVRGLAVGETRIIATNGDLADTAVVTVIEDRPPAPVATVQVFPQDVTIAVGDTLFVGATLRDAEGNVLTDRTVTWTVSPDGVLRTDGTSAQAIFFTAIGAGTATVRAEVEGRSGETTVTVND